MLGGILHLCALCGMEEERSRGDLRRNFFIFFEDCNNWQEAEHETVLYSAVVLYQVY